MQQIDLSIGALKESYQQGALAPRDVIEWILVQAQDYQEYNLFTQLLDMSDIDTYLRPLQSTGVNSLPLWGVPFVIKDNMDLAGIPTTAACKEYRFVPETSATVVQQLIDAGAIPIAKANMDQFATGLVGTRSPYGVCHNAFDFKMLSGGSSSGSAVSLALNLCSFSLGTDTAGSGRVPAAFNNLVGLKPSKGLLSNHGVVPAVRSQDVVSIFAFNAQDAYRVFDVAAQFDEKDSFSRHELALDIPAWPAKPVIGIPDASSLIFCGDELAQRNFTETCDKWVSLGYELKEVPFHAWLETAKLLYGGAWVAERFVAIEAFFERHEAIVDPAVASIIAGARALSAMDAYKGSYALQEAQSKTQSIWKASGIDCMMTPTTPTIYSIEEVQQEPIALNSNLGTYTNFMNLLDYAAIAIPSGFREDNLPAGVTLFAPAGSDRMLMALSDQVQSEFVATAGAKNTPLPEADATLFENNQMIPLAVVGAHLTGFPLNSQLLERNAKWLETTHTAPHYQFYELAGGPVLKPGLVKVPEGADGRNATANAVKGASIELEIWAMPKAHLGSFLALIPSPLGLGKVELADGRQVVGFICEPYGIEGATDITHTGGWRNWMAMRNQ